jgi:hypothetical protein
MAIIGTASNSPYADPAAGVPLRLMNRIGHGVELDKPIYVAPAGETTSGCVLDRPA